MHVEVGCKWVTHTSGRKQVDLEARSPLWNSGRGNILCAMQKECVEQPISIKEVSQKLTFLTKKEIELCIKIHKAGERSLLLFKVHPQLTLLHLCMHVHHVISGFCMIFS